jgi:hypothetical protein
MSFSSGENGKQGKQKRRNPETDGRKARTVQSKYDEVGEFYKSRSKSRSRSKDEGVDRLVKWTRIAECKQLLARNDDESVQSSSRANVMAYGSSQKCASSVWKALEEVE